MTQEEIVAIATSLPGVAVQVAAEGDGSPEIAWGDTFLFAGDQAASRRLPFATIVTKDYPGWDEASRLDRPGAFRLNVAVGRQAYEALLGHSPAAFPAHRDAYDYAAFGQLVPHPQYATQSWVSIVCPGPDNEELVRTLLATAHDRAST